MITAHVKIKGTKPLLMHSAASMLLDRQKTARRAEVPTPEEECEKAVYRKETGELYIPSIAVLGCLANGARPYRVNPGRQSAAGLIRSTVAITPDRIGLGTNKYEIDLQSAVVQTSRIIRARPRLDTWEAEFDISWNPAFGLTPKMISQILTDAGATKGLLDFRPVYGTFEVISFEVEET